MRRAYLPLLLLIAIASASTLRIALGDWGPPAPFAFYPRGPGYVITSFSFDTLVWKDAHGIIPWLAESWTHKGNVWVFHLRKGLKWSDGTPLTANDVVFTFNYIMKHGWQWKSLPKGLIKKIYAPDDNTVVFVLNKDTPFFLDEYASTIFIIPKHIWKDVKDPYNFLSPKAFVCSGPYVLKEYKPNQYYLFVANPYFWGPKPKFEELKVLATGIFNPREAVTALLQGKVDTVTLMGKAYRLVIMAKKAKPSLVVQKGPMYWVLFLGFNLNKYPYNLISFRKAIAYALNLKELVLKAVGSLEAAIPGTPGYVPPYSPFYNPDVPKYPYNVTKAKIILNLLGMKDVNGDGCRELFGKEWRPLLVTTQQFVQEALVIKDMLKKVGICIDIKVVPGPKQLDAIVKAGEFDLEINGHGADGNDPTAFSWIFKTFGTPWYNGAFQAIVNKILNATSLQEAYEYAKRAQYIIAEFLPRIALYYPYQFVLTRPNVHVKWFFTAGGIDGGIPLPYNKLALLR